MLIIILKIIVVNLLFIGFYHFVLAKEKTFRFNRFYLLFSLIFSYIVPFLVITKTIIKTNSSTLIVNENLEQMPQNAVITNGINWEIALLIVYILVCFFFLLQMIFSLLKIMKINGEIKNYNGVKIKIIEECIAPFSFWKTIYIGQYYFQNNTIDNSIFLHEKTHIQQKHTLDLLFIGILKIVSWWNPALYFYRKAVIANHEFLADQSVLNAGIAREEYQNTILQELSTEQFRFAHYINYANIKKRFIMMTTFKHSKFEGLKKVLSICVIITVFFTFSQKSYAYESGITVQTTKNLTKKTPTKFENLKKEFQVKTNTDTIRKSKIEETDLINKKAKNEINTNDETVPMSTQVTTPEGNFVQAKFPGNRDDYRQKIASEFNTSIFNGDEGMVKTEGYIYINENGKVTNIETKGDNEKFNTEAKRVFDTFTKDLTFIPATLDGKSVATVFKIPLTMSFEK